MTTFRRNIWIDRKNSDYAAMKPKFFTTNLSFKSDFQLSFMSDPKIWSKVSGGPKNCTTNTSFKSDPQMGPQFDLNLWPNTPSCVPIWHLNRTIRILVKSELKIWPQNLTSILSSKSGLKPKTKIWPESHSHHVILKIFSA